MIVKAELTASALRRKARLDSLSAIEFPADLPVVQKRADLTRAISENQVVIVCGETGSGKTTQLPKICLTLGRGVQKLKTPVIVPVKRLERMLAGIRS